MHFFALRYILCRLHAADRKVTLGAWKADAARLASEKDRLYDEMCGLRDEAKEASAVMRSVKRVMQPERPQRRQVKKRGMEL